MLIGRDVLAGGLPVIDHIVAAVVVELLGKQQHTVFTEQTIRAFDMAASDGHTAAVTQVVPVAFHAHPLGLHRAVSTKVVISVAVLQPTEGLRAICAYIITLTGHILPTGGQCASLVKAILHAVHILPAKGRLALVLVELYTAVFKPALCGSTVFIVAPAVFGLLPAVDQRNTLFPLGVQGNVFFHYRSRIHHLLARGIIRPAGKGIPVSLCFRKLGHDVALGDSDDIQYRIAAVAVKGDIGILIPTGDDLETGSEHFLCLPVGCHLAIHKAVTFHFCHDGQAVAAGFQIAESHVAVQQRLT